MALSTITALDCASITTIDDAEQALVAIERALQGTELQRLRNFNTTYLLITRAVQRALQLQLFEHPQFMSAFDGQFAQYYIIALQRYVRGQPIAPAWYMTFEAAKLPSAKPLKILALGVNAHVNNDIPQVLLQCKSTTAYKNDYILINGIIGSTLYSVINHLDRYAAPISPKTRAIRPLYALGMRVTIRLWRGNAWRAFEHLNFGQSNVDLIEKRAHLISQGARMLPL